jgi:hypothetical protein
LTADGVGICCSTVRSRMHAVGTAVSTWLSRQHGCGVTKLPENHAS